MTKQFILLIATISFIILSCTNNQGQRENSSNTLPVYEFTLQDLEKLSEIDEASFETFVLEKGYSLDNENSTSKLDKKYLCEKSNPDDKKNILQRQATSKNVVLISFTTTDKNYYLEFKNSLQNDGYQFTESKDDNQTPPTTMYLYTDKKFSSNIFNQTSSDGSIWYTVSIANITKPDNSQNQ